MDRRQLLLPVRELDARVARRLGGGGATATQTVLERGDLPLRCRRRVLGPRAARRRVRKGGAQLAATAELESSTDGEVSDKANLCGTPN